MALPPEPLDELLPQAVTIVLAEVLSVSQAPTPARIAAVQWPIGLGPRLPEATVRLKVERTLRGAPAGEIEVLKPESTYALVPGLKGPFLLDGALRILGRHGPDNYSLETLTQVLGKDGH
jgi:hypothetical protein